MRLIPICPTNIACLRSFAAAACVAAIASAATLRAAEFSPYRARVIAPSAAVRSGPGEKFYTTDNLAEGDAVEVYRERGSWSAIRPPEGSFSWIFGRQLRFSDGVD